MSSSRTDDTEISVFGGDELNLKFDTMCLALACEGCEGKGIDLGKSKNLRNAASLGERFPSDYQRQMFQKCSNECVDSWASNMPSALLL